MESQILLKYDFFEYHISHSNKPERVQTSKPRAMTFLADSEAELWAGG